MKAKYLKPELVIYEIGAIEIICTSGGENTGGMEYDNSTSSIQTNVSKSSNAMQ